MARHEPAKAVRLWAAPDGIWSVKIKWQPYAVPSRPDRLIFDARAVSCMTFIYHPYERSVPLQSFEHRLVKPNGCLRCEHC